MESRRDGKIIEKRVTHAPEPRRGDIEYEDPEKFSLVETSFGGSVNSVIAR